MLPKSVLTYSFPCILYPDETEGSIFYESEIERFCLRNGGIVLTVLAALRADGGLSFWLAPALCGIVLGVFGLALAWLCSDAGRHFRRRLFRTKPAFPLSAPAPARVISFPKAG